MSLVMRIGPGDLLEYNAAHGVIICRECQYAIQKSALQSHLLRHKVFRTDRQELLKFIHGLSILEPEDVPLPSPTSKPIEALPVVSGFRCMVGTCGSLYASSKRMRKHQLELHVDASEVESFESAVRPVVLQTFFRGTKIRYFEVSASTTARGTNRLSDVLEVVNKDKLDTIASSKQYLDVCVEDADIAEPTGPSRLQLDIPLNIDLQTLNYFHHFVSTTSLTLLSLRSEKSSTAYWQVEFIAQALQQKWLMAGLLAITASHMGALAQKDVIAAVHFSQSDRLHLEFAEGRKTYTRTFCDANYPSLPTPCAETLDHIDSLVSCARILRTDGSGSTLQQLFTAMRGLANNRPAALPHKEDAFDRAARLVNTSTSDPALAAVLKHLDALPTRLAEALGRPDALWPVLTALSAVASLIDSCVAGFEDDDVVLWAAVAWLERVGEQFHEMLARNEPAALVVLAHWAASLVRRVEEKGCWFLGGAAEFVITQAVERLASHEHAIRQLVEDL